MGAQDQIFLHPFPLPWLLQDIVVLVVSFAVFAELVRRSKNPTIALLEAVAFIFLYAGIYENAAGVAGLYDFGRSFLMLGFVPISVPLIEVCVLLTGLWILENAAVPKWAMPPVIGMLGILQDLSLDPLAIRQVFTVAGVESARWNWFIGASDAQLLGVPAFNFSGWMLIGLYSSSCLLIGRWIHRKSGENEWVGLSYPVLSQVAALMLMRSPLSALLLWGGPFFAKGSPVEWGFLAFHLLAPTLLLFVLAGRSGARAFTKADLPLFLVPMAMHASDLFFAVSGGYTEILPVSIAATAAHAAILSYVYYSVRLAPAR
jgi:hypothetical protein